MPRFPIVFSLFFTISTLVLTQGNAQSPSPCATEMSIETLTWLKHFTASLGTAPLAKSGNFEIQYIPTKIHIVGNDAGGGYYRTSSLLDAMCLLNQQYEPVGFHFYILGDINFINDQALYDHSSSGSINNQIRRNNVPNAMNVYFVLNPAGACGYFSPFNDYIAMRNSCSGAGNSTFAHEAGHFFSLPHTFNGWENRSPFTAPARFSDELVNGSNCRNAGDFFCDTPADFISDRWTCPYSATKTDFLGQPYNPDGTLYMSYANDACAERFSNEQISAMRNFLTSIRSNFLNLPKPITDPTQPISLVFPFSGQTGIPANYVHLTWEPSLNATHYHVTVTRFNNPNVFNVDTIVYTNSLFLNNLEPGFNYRWRVRPFNAGYTCTPFSSLQNFVTSASLTSLAPEIFVVQGECSGGQNGRVSVLVNGGQPPYRFQWSDGSNQSFVENLSPGFYFTTITDSNNDSVVLPVEIKNPLPLTVSLVQTNTLVFAEVNGGLPPYVLNWSVPASGNFIELTTPQTYSLTVFDSRGCEEQAFFFFNGVKESVESSIKVYPNPISIHQPLVFEWFDRADLSFEKLDIFNSAGQKMDMSYRLEQGRVILNLSTLNRQGVYIYRLQMKEGFLKTGRFTIL